MTRRPLNGSVEVSGDAATHAEYIVAPATDYEVGRGRPVFAPFSGTVTRYWSITGGNTVRVQQSAQLAFVGQHFDAYAGSTGYNDEGAQIAVSGNTGSATTGPHVHCWIELNGVRITFERYCALIGGVETPLDGFTPDGSSPAGEGGYTPIDGDEMNAEQSRKLDAVYAALFGPANLPANQMTWAKPFGEKPGLAYYGALDIAIASQQQIGALAGQLAGLTELVKQLAVRTPNAPSIDLGEIEAASLKGAERALESLVLVPRTDAFDVSAEH